jgi:hypothetical protein
MQGGGVVFMMRRIAWVGAMLLCLIFVLLLQGCDKPSFKTPYQAILLDNGFVYFGKIESTSESFVLLTDVFYVQTQTGPEEKPAGNILIKRGKELHGPDRMYITTRHIIMIEPVSPDSQVAKLIKESQGKSGELQN